MLGFGESPLSIYLNDHLAGSTAGLELARRLHDDSLAEEIEEDRETLMDVMRRLDVDRDELRLAIAWGAEKALRLKPGGHLHDAEALSLGVEGKLVLWVALRHARGDDPRLEGIDFDALIARARSQRERIEQERLRAAEQELA
jgi:hypothetical protein